MCPSERGELEIERVKNYKKGLIIHHWDTDGISSAALFLEYLRKMKKELIIKNYTPTIGNYYLEDREIKRVSSQNYEFIIIADINFPMNNILKLKNTSKAEVFYFDHHIQEKIEEIHHFNPLIEGINDEKYPSASWFVNDYLGNPVNITAILGAVGDHETKLKNKKDVYNVIEDFIEKLEISFDDLLRMTELIDSNYKMGDRNGVLEAPFLLLKNNPEAILEHPKWNKNLEKLRDDVEKQTSKPPTRTEGKILIWEINTPYNTTSAITRRLAWKNKDNIVVVVNKGWFKDRDQVYIRTGNNFFDSYEIINFAKGLGYSAGGKKEVVAAVVPKNETKKFLELLLTKLGANP
ncbi:MAG: DHH family phosphoesterase [Candidatus Freyarchaeum deiterrae]